MISQSGAKLIIARDEQIRSIDPARGITRSQKYLGSLLLITYLKKCIKVI